MSFYVRAGSACTAGNNWVRSVSKEEDYRDFAAHCLDLAKRSIETGDKSRLLMMADAWLNLADKIARLLKRPKIKVGEHPAIRAALGLEREKAE
jgi:hypothetical protein